jgi:hypothetical protein
MSTIMRKQPRCRFRDRVVAAAFALAVPSIALAAEDSVCVRTLNGVAPPGGSIQLKVLPGDPTDPTPIIVDLMSLGLGAEDPGAVQGVTLPQAPDAAGTAVNDGNSLVLRTVSPSSTLELSSVPMIALTIAVSDQAALGTTGLTVDAAASSSLDPVADTCQLDRSSQVSFVVNRSLSITGVLPGGGFLPAGSVVAVAGIGFEPETQVLIDGIAVASTSWVDASRIEVVTAVDAQLDGRKVSVVNPDGTGATYFSYLRATDLGKSARPLLAATEAIFPVQTQSSAVFAAPASGTFFALALQNPQPDDATVSVELWDGGSVVASASLTLPPRTKVSREISELFPGVTPGAESFFQLTATLPMQLLGLSGNETDGSVAPVLPALASP